MDNSGVRYPVVIILLFLLLFFGFTLLALFQSSISTFNIPISDQEPVSFVAGLPVYAPVQATSIPQYITELISKSDPVLPLNLFLLTIIFVTIFLLIYLNKLGISFANSLKFLILQVVNTRYYSGVIFDSKTYKPLPLAKVTIFNKAYVGAISSIVNPVEIAITDLSGRYSLKTEQSNNYNVEFSAIEYKPLVKSFNGELDVSLSKLSLNSKLIKILGIDKVKLIKWLRVFIVLLSLWGFTVTIYVEAFRATIVNVILMGIYSMMFMLVVYPLLTKIFLKKVKVEDNEDPVEYAIVRAIKNREVVDLSVANKNGEVTLNLRAGVYKIVSNKKGYSSISKEVEVSDDSTLNLKLQMSLKSLTPTEKESVDLHEQIIKNNQERFKIL